MPQLLELLGAALAGLTEAPSDSQIVDHLIAHHLPYQEKHHSLAESPQPDSIWPTGWHADAAIRRKQTDD